MKTIKLLELDCATSNSGRIYPRAVIEKAITEYLEKMPSKQMLIFDEPAIKHTDMKHIVGLAENLRIENSFFVADVEFIEEARTV